MRSGIYDLSGNFIEAEKWIDGLSAFTDRKPCVAFIGAGGKTTNMFNIARNCAKTGKKVLVTTSTHIKAPAKEFTALCMDTVKDIWSKKLPVAIGTIQENELKWSQPDPVFFKKIYDKADIVLIEADGSKGRPCKVMRDHEPVIWNCVTHTVSVIGLSALGKSIAEGSYPPELVADILRTKQDHILKLMDMAALVQRYWQGDAQWQKIHVPVIMLNQADGMKEYNIGLELAYMLKKRMKAEIYITHYDFEHQHFWEDKSYPSA